MKVDSKGRVSIPAFLRKNFNLSEGSKIAMLFDISDNFAVLIFDGQCGVTASTRGCGSLRAGSNALIGEFGVAGTSSRAGNALLGKLGVAGTSSRAESPAIGPKMKEANYGK